MIVWAFYSLVLGDLSIVLLCHGSWSSGIGLGCPSHAYLVLVFLVMLDWVWLVHSKGLATHDGMVKSSLVWVHTHWVSIDLDGCACVEMVPWIHQLEHKLMEIFPGKWRQFLEDKLDHWTMKKTHGKVLKWKIEERSEVGPNNSRRGTWKSINKSQDIHSYHSHVWILSLTLAHGYVLAPRVSSCTFCVKVYSWCIMLGSVLVDGWH